MIRRVAWSAALLLSPPILYVVCAGVLGLIGVNRDFVPTRVSAGGVPVFLRTNGIHADIVLPTRTSDRDWSVWFPASHMRDVAQPAPWIAFGWGDRTFMIETPTWCDIRLGTALRALLGLGPGAMHVEYIAEPKRYAVTAVSISRAQHARMVAAISRSFGSGDEGKPRRIDAAGYFGTDAFYEAVPVYSWRYTCNEWVRQVLSDAGLPAPAWAPFERPLIWHLARHTSATGD